MRALIISNHKGVTDKEIIIIRKTLERAGHTVKLASLTRNSILTKEGTEFKPDFAIFEVNPDFFNAVFVVGEGAAELVGRRNILSIVRAIALRGKICGGITNGPLVLGAAGILGGKKATVYPKREAIKELIQDNAKYSNEHVVSDGNIVTADDPESVEDFVKEICLVLQKA